MNDRGLEYYSARSKFRRKYYQAASTPFLGEKGLRESEQFMNFLTEIPRFT